MNNTPILELKELSRKFSNVTALDGVSLTLDAPQVTCLLGANGAGKSTLMRLITGFLPPDSGSIKIAGEDMLKNGKSARNHLGYLPENAPVFHDMRVVEELQFFAEIHGIPANQQHDAIEAVMAKCELTEVRNRMTSQLSKGFRHRLGLAQAIIHNPSLIILDEPTDGLDPAQKEATRKLIRQLGKSSAVLISTHILDEVPAVCDRVVILTKGKITFDGPLPPDLATCYYQRSRQL